MTCSCAFLGLSPCRHAGRPAAPPPPARPPCAHEGAVIEPCPAGDELRHVRDCDLHDRCTRGPSRVRSCATCPDYLPPPAPGFPRPAPTVRHVLYHVYPRWHSPWRTRILRLREALPLFNGVKAVAVATDRTTEGWGMVADALSGTGCEVFEVPNNPELREVATLGPLLDRVAHLTGPEHATCYAHAKGVTRPAGHPAHRWAEALEELLWSRWDRVADDLTWHPITGAFRKTGRGWPAHQSKCDWHYSGSWFWVRNDALFARPDWRRAERFWSGVETYPSLHFAAHEAGCLFHPGAVASLNLYDPGYWARAVEPDLARWRGAARG